MDKAARQRKKVDAARRLRAATPQETLRMGFSLMEFGWKLAEAARRSRP